MGYVEMIALGKAKHDGCGLTRYGFGINVHAQLIAQLSAQIQANSCGALDASSVTPYKTLIKIRLISLWRIPTPLSLTDKETKRPLSSDVISMTGERLLRYFTLLLIIWMSINSIHLSSEQTTWEIFSVLMQTPL